MKKRFLVLQTLGLFLFCFVSCGTTPAVAKPAVVDEDPKDTPEVKFAKSLRRELTSGDVKSALELFENMPEQMKDDEGLLMLQASLCVSDGQYDKAKKIADSLLEKNPEDIETLELCSVIAKASNNTMDYQKYRKMILTADPYNASANIQLAEDYAIQKKYKNSFNTYRKALVREPNNTDALFGYAQMAFYLDDLKTSKDALEKIIALDPENAPALAYLGKLSADEENYLRATKYVQDAIKYDPENYDYYMDLGQYCRNQGKYKDAVKAWEKAASIEPGYFLAYAYLAGLYDEQNEVEKALENYKHVIETNPEYYYAYEETAILQWHMGQWADARQNFQKAFDVGGKKDWSYALMIYACYVKDGKQNEGKTFLQNFIKKMDKFAWKTNNKNKIEMTNELSNEYSLVKFYCDNFSKTGLNQMNMRIQKEESTTKRGKMLFYMGLYSELFISEPAAAEYYTKVTAMQAPLFFEYRIAEWGLGL